MTHEEYNREYRSLAAARDMAVKVNDKKVAKHYRQQISRLYEGHGKDLKEAPIEEIEQDRLDAQRYRKLKSFMQLPTTWGSGLLSIAVSDDIDAAVDALPVAQK